MKKIRLILCFSIGAMLSFSTLSGQKKYEYPFHDPSLSVEQRVTDLVSRLTLEEKVSQMVSVSPEISRLGIPACDWWNEALHGVARAGIATVFPQAIGMAATWDTNLIFDVADIISTEARAKYHEGIRTGDKTQFRGLTIWSPNINIFRDPRWGRGQETYGEDPFLTSRIGISFVKGLQGNNPKYLKTISTPKHFAVHSGPEPARHYFDAVTNPRDLWETYLPAFEALVREGGAMSVMSAYNRYLGEPCSSSPMLLQQILREKWGFKGYVVSDCDAILDIWHDHKTVKTDAEAAAISAKAGCDLNCGDTYLALVKAVNSGLITEKEIDVNLKRLFEARFRLGLFDPDELVEYAQIPFSANDTEGNRKVALKAAQESIILLKNSNKTLPLKKDLKTIAVIGPNASNERVMYGNYNGTPSKAVTPLEGIKNKVSANTKVLFAKGCNWVTPANKLEAVTQNLLSFGEKQGLHAEYFDNKLLEGTPVVDRVDKQIDFDWEVNPPNRMNMKTNFSARWTGILNLPESGKYMLSLTGDDGYRMYIDNELIFDKWQNQPLTVSQKEFEMVGGKDYDIRIEYFQSGGDGVIRFEYALNQAYDPMKEATDIASQSDVVIFFGGISPLLEGEEMKVNYEGFNSGDRVKIDLPAIQDSLLRILYATGKPVVLVLMSGSALAVNWADQNLPAIMQSWYPGEEGGTAVADVLFGDFNPAGRLPITFYKSADQLPPFEDYAMKGRTYRYFEGEPLYPFGFGLSYSTYQYSNLKCTQAIKTGESLGISADVKNTSLVAGEEVVQFYTKLESSSYPTPIRSLQGFQRISLNPGEKKTVTFKLNPRQMSVVDDNGKRLIVPGNLMLSIGGGQPNQAKKLNIATISGKVKISGKSSQID
ncbi:MAG TPA: glycoside hydrolase family 3 C-terminal domain-containing protein [Prolixibacteraceae bacterium]|nr:glycoside hydrolase family 3 C-terminal domain-containing protein [Prolixibacteraceae bacterium]